VKIPLTNVGPTVVLFVDVEAIARTLFSVTCPIYVVVVILVISTLAFIRTCGYSFVELYAIPCPAHLVSTLRTNTCNLLLDGLPLVRSALPA